jgi:hypothetical protein
MSSTAATLDAAAALAASQGSRNQAMVAAYDLLRRRPGALEAWEAAEGDPSHRMGLTVALFRRYSTPAGIAQSLRRAAREAMRCAP